MSKQFRWIPGPLLPVSKMCEWCNQGYSRSSQIIIVCAPEKSGAFLLPSMIKEYVSKEQLDAHRKLVNLAFSLGTSFHRLENHQELIRPAFFYLKDEKNQDEFIAKTFLTMLEEEISIVKKMKRDIDAAFIQLGLNDEQNRNS